MRVLLHGTEAEQLRSEVERHDGLEIVEHDPEIVICYGGDGTLLSAELAWPGLPKVPILNSHRGKRCIPHPPEQVIDGLARGELVHNAYTKLACALHRGGRPVFSQPLLALNEINVHMGRINSAVRFKLWINDDPYDAGKELLGDGFLVCTPFGSTAYFEQITRGIFSKGIGIAFKATSEHINHVVLPEDTVCRVLITRGPAVLAYDSSQEFYDLELGDELVIKKHTANATILTCGPVKRLDQPF